MSAPAVILVRPQLGENIGAVARAMSNFGLSELRLVAPKNGWPNERAWDMATSATGILDKAKLFKTTAEAMHGIHFALGTSARLRGMEKPVCVPEEAARALVQQAQRKKRTALVFGPERTGLTNEDVVLCDGLITIPTSAENPSLNLAQAAVILGYEWLKAVASCKLQVASEVKSSATYNLQLATKQELQGYFDQLEAYLDEVNHFRTDDKKHVMWQNLRTIFIRAALNPQEVRTLRGVARALYMRRKE